MGSLGIFGTGYPSGNKSGTDKVTYLATYLGDRIVLKNHPRAII